MIGRYEELKSLSSLLNEDEPQFVAVLGRRRVGKTYLVRNAFEYSFTFEHTGVSNTLKTKKKNFKRQLEEFTKSLKKYGYDAGKEIENWDDAFSALEKVVEQSSDRKKVIFIDELSWMDVGNNGLISALEHFYNGFVSARKERDVILIVCASATNWVINNVINAKGGLHNRITMKIFLKPFTLKECEEYMASRNVPFNRLQILQCYMALGGVPYYWSLIKNKLSVYKNLDNLFFDENALLSDEFDNLYAALYDSPAKYLRIIEALSLNGHGLTRDEIAKEIQVTSSGDLSTKLKELEKCGFIRRYIPFGRSKNTPIYQLIDNYTLFYHHFIKGKNPDPQFMIKNMNSPTLNSWRGFSFEKVCLLHIEQIKKALGISGILTETSSWRCHADSEKGIQGSQIDLLIERKDQVINLCEMKYSADDYQIGSAFEKDMNRKISDLLAATKTKSSIQGTLVTTFSHPKNASSDCVQSIITLDDLFQ